MHEIDFSELSGVVKDELIAASESYSMPIAKIMALINLVRSEYAKDPEVAGE